MSNGGYASPLVHPSILNNPENGQNTSSTIIINNIPNNSISSYSSNISSNSNTSSAISSSSSDGMFNINNSNNSAQFHPIACNCCRRNHKQCDRLLPKCSRCIEKNQPCEYKTPLRKRNPLGNNSSKKKKSSSIPKNVITYRDWIVFLSNPDNLTRENVVKFHKVYHIIEFIDPLEFEKYVLYYDDEDSNCSNSNSVDEESKMTRKEYIAFFYSWKAITQQMIGRADDAEESANKARKKVFKLNNRVASYLVACTHFSLGQFEFGAGRTTQSKYHTYIALFYFNNMTETQKANMSKHEIRLMRILSVNESISNIDFDFRTMISKLPRIFELTTGIEIPPEIKQITQQEVSLSNIGDYLKIVDIMVLKLSEHYQQETNNIHTQLIETTAKLILNGLRLAVLLKSGYDRSVIEEGALRILYIAETNSDLPIHTLPYMALSSKFHLQIVKNIEQGLMKNNRDNILSDGKTGPVDYYTILERDLHLLKGMGLKYKRVQTYYGHLIEEIELILRVKRSRNEVTIPLEENLGVGNDESFLNIFKDIFGFNFDGFY